MSHNGSDTNELDHIKYNFITSLHDDKKPTLEDYIRRYPEHTDELIDFILTYAEIFSGPEPQEDCDMSTASEAMDRALASGESKARTLLDRLAEIGSTEEEFADRVGVPFDLYSELGRRKVNNVASWLWSATAKALGETIARTRRLVAPQGAILAHRAEGSVDEGPIEFTDLLRRMHEHGRLTDDQLARLSTPREDS